MNTVGVNTPHYVLLDDKHRIGPRLLSAGDRIDGVCLYGFSDKELYDLFCKNSSSALRPYPLVKGYLRGEIADASEAALQLVILDAAGPTDPVLNAATMTGVLDALELDSKHVRIAFRLLLDRDLQSYRVEKVSSDAGESQSLAAS